MKYKKRIFYKACNEYVNHTPIVKTLPIRTQYRVYLAEMEAYKFMPQTFREWYRNTQRSKDGNS